MNQEHCYRILNRLTLEIERSGVRLVSAEVLNSDESERQDSRKIDIVIVSNDFVGRGYEERRNIISTAQRKVSEKFKVKIDILLRTYQEYLRGPRAGALYFSYEGKSV